jgi:predicted  nucleic acid-binding Zn-ribbon protein
MKKLAEIKNQLASTNTRITELEGELNQQTATFEATQTAFVGGKANLGELHAEQSKLSLLTQSVESLQATASELQTAFDEMTEAEARQNLLESAKAAANESEKLWNEALAHRIELDDAIGELAEKFVGKMFEFHAKRKSYLNLRGQLEPTTKIPEISDDAIRLLEKNHLNFPPIRFGLSVQAACEVIEKEREKSELAERQAEKARQMSPA